MVDKQHDPSLRRQILSSLQKFVEATMQIGSGRLGSEDFQTLPINHNNEIGLLSFG